MIKKPPNKKLGGFLYDLFFNSYRGAGLNGLLRSLGHPEGLPHLVNSGVAGGVVLNHINKGFQLAVHILVNGMDIDDLIDAGIGMLDGDFIALFAVFVTADDHIQGDSTLGTDEFF